MNIKASADIPHRSAAPHLPVDTVSASITWRMSFPRNMTRMSQNTLRQLGKSLSSSEGALLVQKRSGMMSSASVSTSATSPGASVRLALVSRGTIQAKQQ